jgi:TM2 domain-containing membrane protein YozV
VAESAVTAPDASAQQPLVVDLKDRHLAALFAWLIPGAGHMYQGRWGKGALFSFCILGTFFTGMVFGEGKVVYAAWSKDPDKRRLYYFLQIGVGLPALPALVQAAVPSRPLGDFMAPPRYPREGVVDKDGRHYKDELSMWFLTIDAFEMGTIYTAIAGLLNILAIYDAWAGPVIIEDEKKDKKKPPA